MKSEGRLRTTLLALLFLAPLPFGCIEDWSHWLLVTLLGLAFCFFLRGGIPLLPDRRLRVALLLGLAYLAWLGFQMIPLPPAAVALLSPSAARLYEMAVPGLDGTAAAGYAHPDAASLPGSSDEELHWITPRFSTWRSLSLYPYGTWRIFWLTAAMLAFVVMGASLFRAERHRRRLAATLIGVGAVQALYGAIETLSGHQHILFYEKRFYTDVATGTLINRNHYAGMINMVLPFAAGLLMAGRAGGRGETASRFPLREPLLAAAVIVMGIGVILSRSRMGLASTIAGLLALVLFLWTGVLSRAAAPGGRLRLLASLALPAGLLVLIAFYAIGIDTGGTFERFHDVGSDLAPEAIRPALWRETLPVARDFLLTGSGAGAFVHALNPKLQSLPIGDFWLFQHAHNDYLEWIVMLGIVGLALGGSAFLAHAARRPRSVLQAAALAGLVTLFVHASTDFNLSIPSNCLIACALLILIAPETSSETAGGSRHRRGNELLVAVLIVLAAWPGRSLVAALVYRPHYHEVTHLPAARSALAIAGAVEPGNDTFLRYRADGEREAALRLSPEELDVGGDLEKQVFDWRMSRLAGLSRAQDLYLRSLDRNPMNYEIHFAVARVESEIRALARDARLAGDDIPGPADPVSVLSPHRASAGLGPTAYENLGRLGVLIWNERAPIGEEGAAYALDLMGRAAEEWQKTGTDWIERVVLAARDPLTLSRLDGALKPPSLAYAHLLEEGKDLDSTTSTCARALQILAQLREATMLYGWHVDRLNILEPEQLAGLKDRLRWLDVNADVMAPSGNNGPCDDGRDVAESVRTGSLRLLETMEGPTPQ